MKASEPDQRSITHRFGRSTNPREASGQRAPLVEPDAADSYSPGQSHLGVSVPDGTSAVTAIRRRTRSPVQGPDGLGPADAAGGTALVAWTAADRGSGQCVRGRQVALRPPAGPSDHRHHPAPPGCRPLRSGARTRSWPEGPTPAERQPFPDPSLLGLRSRDALGARQLESLVREDRPGGRDRFSDRGLVSQWPSTPSDARGPGPRSRRQILCPGLAVPGPPADPLQILESFVQRWQLEVTCEEVRVHLGVETQRQWTDLAIARTAPALLGLFSPVTLMAHQRWRSHETWVRRAAWYNKMLPTFVEPGERDRLFAHWRQDGE